MQKAVFRKPVALDGFVGVDMHFHTDRSQDSLARIDNTLRRARKLGIGVAITDHNTVSGALRCFNAKGVLVIPGVELTSQEGSHTILYFSTKRECAEWARKVLAPLRRKDPFRLPVSTTELYERAKPYNAVICAPHPFGIGITGIHKSRITQKMERSIDVVEGINAYTTHRMNLRAIAWAEELEKPITAGSDGHVAAELGQALSFCEADNVHEFLHELVRGHSLAMGKENSLYEKARVGFEKEEHFFHEAHKTHRAFRLLRDQFGSEWTYLKSRVKNGLLHRSHAWFERHHG
ncbi:MAG TPA: PHP domain-containing protein [Candidatus Binatia bacterium]|nr:PHP domain-containing protein [Candidatus Binatia bacterium]